MSSVAVFTISDNGKAVLDTIESGDNPKTIRCIGCGAVFNVVDGFTVPPKDTVVRICNDCKNRECGDPDIPCLDCVYSLWRSHYSIKKGKNYEEARSPGVWDMQE